MSCQEASRAQSDEMERPLPRATRLGLWLHLLLCRWCRRYGRQIRFLRKAAGGHPEKLAESETAKLSAEARDRIKGRLRDGK